MMKLKWSKPVAALCLALALAACAAAPTDKDIAAPEFPGRMVTTRRWRRWKSRAPISPPTPARTATSPASAWTAAPCSAWMPARVILWFNTEGALTSVNAYVAAADRETLQANMETAMGAPAESYRPAMRGAALGGAAFLIEVPQESILNENYLACTVPSRWRSLERGAAGRMEGLGPKTRWWSRGPILPAVPTRPPAAGARWTAMRATPHWTPFCRTAGKKPPN